MSRLDRLILSEIVAPFFGSLLLFTALFMGADDLLKIMEYAHRGVSVLILLQFFLFALPPILALTSPMSMLLATLLGFGRLSGDSELTALSAAGAPLERILAPVAAFAFVVSCIGIWINDTVIPTAARQRQAIIDDQKRAVGQIVGSQTFNYRQADNKGRIIALIHVEGPLSGIGGGRFRMEDVTVTFYRNGIPYQVVHSPMAEGTLGSADWQFHSFISFGRDQQGQPTVGGGQDGVTKDATETLAAPEALQVSARPDEELTTSELREKARLLRDNKDVSGARQADVEIARRFALPFGSLVFALVGAPLGISPQRSGKGVGFGYSVLITFLYWIALQSASILGENGVLPPLVAVLTPDIVGLVVATYLIYRARR